MRKKALLTVQTAVGLALLLGGFYLMPSEEVKLFSGLCIGIGAALFALGLGGLMQQMMISAAETEEWKRVKTIEINDERNIRIKERAGYMVAKSINYLLCLLILIAGFLRTDLHTILFLVSLLIAEFILAVFFSSYYSKKM